MKIGRLEYIWHHHPRPWKMNVGEIEEYLFDDNEIRVKFSYNPNETLVKIDDKVYLEVLDANNRTVMEGLFPQTHTKGTLGLR